RSDIQYQTLEQPERLLRQPRELRAGGDQQRPTNGSHRVEELSYPPVKKSGNHGGHREGDGEGDEAERRRHFPRLRQRLGGEVRVLLHRPRELRIEEWPQHRLTREVQQGHHRRDDQQHDPPPPTLDAALEYLPWSVVDVHEVLPEGSFAVHDFGRL